MTTDKLSKVVTREDLDKLQGKNILISLALRLPCECNLNCSYCYGKIDTKGGVLKHSEIENLLLQASNLKVRTIEIVGEGEPLLYPKIKKLIGYIDELGMIPTLYSNCTLITLDLAKFLFEHNTTVIGKQNTLLPDKQDTICRTNGTYQKIMTGLNNLMTTGFTHTTPSRLGMHTVVLQENLEEIPLMWREWRNKNIIPQVQAIVFPSEMQAKQYFEYYYRHASTPQQTRRLFETLANIDKEEFAINWNPIEAYPIAPDGCRVVYGTIGITSEGNIQICSYTEKPLGNIRDTTIEEIMQSAEVKKIRNIGKILGYPDERYGCRANAYNMTKDRFASDPFFDKFLRETS